MKLALSKFKITRLLSTIIIVMFLLAVPVSAANISVFVNGTEMISDSLPINDGGNILVPASSMFQMFDSDVVWDSKAGTMVVTAPGMRVTIKTGDSSAIVNGKTVNLDTTARIVNGRLYVPAKFIADTFGAKTNWDKNSQSLTITGASDTKKTTNMKDYAKSKIQAAIDGLSTSFSIEFDATENVAIQDLLKLDDYKEIKSWSYEGTKTNDKIIVTWKLELSDEHAIVSAYRNPSLESKLTDRQKEMLRKCKQIMTGTVKPSMTDFQKQLAIHDYLVLNCEYDIDTYNAQNATGYEDTFLAYGALINGVAVCGGYTDAANILLKMAGIESSRLDSDDHAWNLVKLDGGYYHMDVSWDDPTPDVAGRIRHDYFNLTDKQISQYSSHNWLNKEAFPMASAVKYNYFVYNNLVANNRNELKQVLTKAIKAGEREITVMVTNHRTGGYVWDQDLEFIFGLLGDSARAAKFSYSPPNSERDTLTVVIGL